MTRIEQICMWLGAGALAVCAVLPANVGQPGPVARPMALRHHGTNRILRQREDGTTESSNWAGYAVTASKGGVTDVKGSWKVPAAGCTTADANGYSSFWIGIDGWTSSTVEQIGTDSDCVSLNGRSTNTPTYYAWFEFYPQSSYVIEFPKAMLPGDIVSAEVTATPGSTLSVGRFSVSSGSKFTVTLTDETTGYKFSTSSSVPNAQQSSAEWIAEAPCCGNRNTVLPLAPFGVVSFGEDSTGVANTSYATISGKAGALGSFGSAVQESVMVGESNSKTIKAQPSALSSDGSSFSVQWYSPGP